VLLLFKSSGTYALTLRQNQDSKALMYPYIGMNPRKKIPKGHNIWPPGVSYIVEGKTLSSARPRNPEIYPNGTS
jgi:hypothetical protein